jgi:hypothetical protein
MNWLNGFVSIANAYRSLVLERIWVMRRDTRRVSETFPSPLRYDGTLQFA